MIWNCIENRETYENYTYHFRGCVHHVRASMLMTLLIPNRQQIGVQSQVQDTLHTVQFESHRQHVSVFDILEAKRQGQVSVMAERIFLSRNRAFPREHAIKLLRIGIRTHYNRSKVRHYAPVARHDVESYRDRDKRRNTSRSRGNGIRRKTEPTGQLASIADRPVYLAGKYFSPLTISGFNDPTIKSYYFDVACATLLSKSKISPAYTTKSVIRHVTPDLA